MLQGKDNGRWTDEVNRVTAKQAGGADRQTKETKETVRVNKCLTIKQVSNVHTVSLSWNNEKVTMSRQANSWSVSKQVLSHYAGRKANKPGRGRDKDPVHETTEFSLYTGSQIWWGRQSQSPGETKQGEYPGNAEESSVQAWQIIWQWMCDWQLL